MRNGPSRIALVRHFVNAFLEFAQAAVRLLIEVYDARRIVTLA